MFFCFANFVDLDREPTKIGNVRCGMEIVTGLQIRWPWAGYWRTRTYARWNWNL